MHIKVCRFYPGLRGQGGQGGRRGAAGAVVRSEKIAGLLLLLADEVSSLVAGNF